MAHVVVAGKVECEGASQAGATIDVVLIRAVGGTPFQSSTASGADGIWIIDFDVGLDIADFRFAMITIRCPNGTVHTRRSRLRETPGRMLRQTLQIMFENIATEIISRILGLPIITPILSSDFVVLIASGGKVECCPPEETVEPPPPQPPQPPPPEPPEPPQPPEPPEEPPPEPPDEPPSEPPGQPPPEPPQPPEPPEEPPPEPPKPPEEEPNIRTRICYDLKGTATSKGQGGITVSGISVTTDINPGDTAEEIFSKLAAMLRARGFDVQGPTKVPGTDEVIMYVNSDAAGKDPTGGGIGTVDVKGLGRLSVFRQQYEVALAVAIPNEPMQVVYSQSAAPNVIEFQLIDVRSGEPMKYRCNVKGIKDPAEICKLLVKTIADVTFSRLTLKSKQVRLMTSTDQAAYYRVVAVATESATETAGSKALFAGSSAVQFRSDRRQDTKGKKK